MSRIFVLASVLLAVFSFVNRSVANEAPDFSINTPEFKGQLSDFQQTNVVYVDFWASWCSPCRRSFPWMNSLLNKYAEDGLVVVAVNVDKERELADDFLRQVPAEFLLVFDSSGGIARTYEVLGMPSSYLIDKTGKIRFVHTGFYQEKIDSYEAELKLLLNEKPEASNGEI